MVRARRSHDWGNGASRNPVCGCGYGRRHGAGGSRAIFEAFFTTKEVTGTGLGLWVSQEIVLKHHGLVRVRSRVAAPAHESAQGGSGTVFQVFIPDGPGRTAKGAQRQANVLRL